MTADISARLQELGRQICPDAEVRRWFYTGGPLPA